MNEKEAGITADEAITELRLMRTDPWTDSRQMQAIELAIKALKQYGILQVIRDEIDDSPSVMLTTGEDAYERGINAMLYMALRIVDKHIKEIEE